MEEQYSEKQSVVLKRSQSISVVATINGKVTAKLKGKSFSTKYMDKCMVTSLATVTSHTVLAKTTAPSASSTPWSSFQWCLPELGSGSGVTRAMCALDAIGVTYPPVPTITNWIYCVAQIRKIYFTRFVSSLYTSLQWRGRQRPVGDLR